MTSPPSFDTVTDWARDPNGVRRGRVPASWMQGRAAFGGLVAGVALRSLRDLVPDLPLLGLHVDFIGPLTADVGEAHAQVTRRGRSITHAHAEILQGDDVRARLSASFGRARPSSIVVPSPTLAEDQRPDPDSVTAMPYLEGIAPVFTQHVAMAFCEGGHPFSGTGTTHVAGWCRHRTDPGPPEVALVGLLDTWPAPVLAMLEGPAPASSVSWTTRFEHVPATIGTEDWFWYRSSTSFAADGYAHMEATLWDRAGRAVARLEQLVAIFDGR